jgi:twitching motility protein PilT
MSLKDWISKARALGASDLHLEADTPVVARIRGELKDIAAVVPGALVTQTARDLLGAEAWPQFLARGSADVSVTIAGTRCRISFYRTVRGVGIAARLLAPSVSDLRTCNLHPELHKLIEATSGLVVVSGPTGSGKSTTLAALIEELNSSRARHIISLESPLEYLFTNRRSLIRQREIPTHSPSFEQAIIDSLRENPDVLVIGEMRTPEVIRLTLSAAETGHLVLATMHSATCAEALNRICMSFPAEIQGSIRAQLADCLVGVVCQRLEFLESQRMRVPQCEILFANIAAKGTIRTGQMSQIANVIQAGGEDGMWTFDRYQRWMAQKTDWKHPVAAAPIPETRGSASLPAVRATQSERAPAPSKLAALARTMPAVPKPAHEDGPIEITIDEDLSLAELAKKLEDKTR